MTVSKSFLVSDDVESFEEYTGQVFCEMPLYWNFSDIF